MRSLRHTAVAALLVLLVSCGGSGTATTEAQRVAEVEPATAVPDPTAPPTTPTPEPTTTRTPTATPVPSPTVEPTATAEPDPTPITAPQPTASPSPTPTPTNEPTAAATSTPETAPLVTGDTAFGDPDDPDPDKTQVPTDYDGEIRAIRTAGGVMLTVRSAGPPWEVVTPCYEIGSVAAGLTIEGPVDVLIDPGHGGEETGAVGPNGLVEADLNLVVAEALRDRLVDMGLRVLMTRYSDHRMAIQARTELANALAPRIFISIHHNGGFPEPVDRPGTEVFVQQDDPDSTRLGGLLFEEMQAEFADLDIAWVGTDALGVSWRVNERGTDLYGVLRRTPQLTSVLTEAMYLTSAPEAEYLATDEAVQAEADALARAIERFLSTDEPGSGFIDGLVFRGDLGNGGGTDGCVDPPLN